MQTKYRFKAFLPGILSGLPPRGGRSFCKSLVSEVDMESSKWFYRLDELRTKDPDVSDVKLEAVLNTLLTAEYGSKPRPKAAELVRDWRKRNENRHLLQTIEPPRD